VNPEDLVLMLNLGWSLQEIADHTKIPIKILELIIVHQTHVEKVTERELSLA
jgi:hypothetical protein